jgi:Protein of unknown function (DUF3795)
MKGNIVKGEDIEVSPSNKKLSAVCGLYCEACTLFIATIEDPKRLKDLAARLGLSEDAIKCYGCRSDKRWPYCEKCTMFACAAGRGIDFCSQCREYPCEDLKKFQAAMPHRIELWNDLERIKAIGYEQWLREIRAHYSCPQCDTINSAYDIKCRKCGGEPSCEYVGRHRQAIEQYFRNR